MPTEHGKKYYLKKIDKKGNERFWTIHMYTFASIYNVPCYSWRTEWGILGGKKQASSHPAYSTRIARDAEMNALILEKVNQGYYYASDEDEVAWENNKPVKKKSKQILPELVKKKKQMPPTAPKIEPEELPRRYECTVGGSSKFWTIQKIKKLYPTGHFFGYMTSWGKIGKKGQSKEKWFGGMTYTRNVEYNKLINSKLKKGYVPVVHVVESPSKPKVELPKLGKAKKEKQEEERDNSLLNRLDNLEL